MKQVFPKRRLFDSHCHLEEVPGDTKIHVEAAVAAGVELIVAVAVDLDSSRNAIALEKLFPEQVIAAVGIQPEILVPGSDLFDPEFDEEHLQQNIAELKSLVITNEIKMIGECGLDYYWLNKNETITAVEKDKSIALQKMLLHEQLKLARLFALPVSLHSRAAEDDCIKAVAEFGNKFEAIFHSFTGSYQQAAQILEMGGKIGINGIITYKSAAALRDTLKKLIGKSKVNEPGDLYNLGFYLETDAPLLTPGNSTLHESFNSPKQIPFIWNFVYNLLNS